MNHSLKFCISFLFLIGILLLNIKDVGAQMLGIKYIRKINSLQGLSHNIINDIEQDEKGFIWIATQDGLNRYDGYQFKVYRFDPKDSTSISDNYIKSIYHDNNNHLWISTRYALNLYNPEYDNFKRFQLKTGDELDITKIAGSAAGGLWISNYLGSILYFDDKNNAFKGFSPEDLPQTAIMTILEDREGMIWVGSGGEGVRVYNQNEGLNKPNLHLNKRIKKIEKGFIEVLFEDSNSNIWIGTREGIILYYRKLNEFIQIQRSNSQQELSGNIILDIQQDHEGNILIGTQEGGLNILSLKQLKTNNPLNFKFQKILYGNEDYNLSYRSIQSIFEDRDKNIWIGTYGNGLNMIPFEQPKFNLIKHSIDRPNSLNLDKVWGICEDNEGFLWIGTDGMGINRIDLETGEVTCYLSGKQAGSLSDDAILCALCDSKGQLWFGTYAGGLNLFNKANNSFRHINLNTKKKDSQTVRDVRCLFEDKSGAIWIGTNGNGLRKLNTNDFSIEQIVPASNTYSAFDIRAITQDNEGLLWLGTYGGGLFSYDPETKNAKQFAFDRFRPGTLKCNIIYSLLFDEVRNCLWIGGSQNGGLNKLDLKSLKFTVYDAKNGLGNNNIHAIEKDGKGRIWLSTNTGISLFIPENELFLNYNKLDGVQAKEFSDGSVFKSRKHNLIFFGGSGGLNYFNADNIGLSTAKTNILITDLKILSEPASKKNFTDTEIPIKTNLLYPNKIILDHTQNIFSIGFSGIYYSNPEKILYQYKLEGEDLNWNNLGNQQSVTFRNLNPGNYEFKVRASNEDGIWSDDIDTLLITIKTPFWKTQWAYLFYVLVAGSIITWIYFYNLKEAKIRHNLVSEKKMRTQEHQLYEERINFFTNISHELRTPLMLLINPLEDLITRETKNTTLGRTFNSMYRSAQNLFQLINTLLEFRKMENGKLRLNATKQNIVEHIEETCLAFRGIMERKNIQLIFNSEENIINAWFDREKLEMIINNLLSNAIKNTDSNKRIFVTLKTNDEADKDFPEGKLKIEVRDEGSGIPADQLNRIFEGFYQVRGTNAIGGTGIGLALTKRLIELHKGTINVESEIKKGSVFTIYLHLGDSHIEEDEKISDIPGIESTSIFLGDADNDSIGRTLEKIASLSKEKPRILVVEDNEEIRNYFYDLLKDYFIVEVAGDGLSGLELAKKNQPALVISDIMMPGLDGVELCKLIKSEIGTSHIPVLLITANISHHVHINSLDVGADAYITKPFKPDLLIARIYNLLKSRIKLRDYYIAKFRSGFPPEDAALSKDEEFLISVNKIIHRNIDNSEFSITQLHEELCMSRTVFYNKIKSLTNYSPIDLIRQVRLRKAADLLSTKQFKVYEVMYQVGFNDEKHFRQLFKNQFRVTPVEYQNASKQV